MGYTHHDKICGVTEVAVGAKGSEITVADSSGYLYSAGTKVAGSGGLLESTTFSLTVNFATAASVYTTTTAIPIGVAPFAGAVTGYFITGVSAGTGRAFQVQTGTTGTVLAANAASGVTGTVGAILTLAASSGGNTVAAGTGLYAGMVSCATAQTGVFAVTVTRTA